ncbi:MAG TPA: hypothetical protein VK747_10750, partial [Blastocatellia bacterium]|nr:hypothetical protein [Blastocatellia bacterium]
MCNRSIALLIAGLIALAGPSARPRPERYIPYEEARPILEALSEVAPAELKTATPADIASV